MQYLNPDYHGWSRRQDSIPNRDHSQHRHVTRSSTRSSVNDSRAIPPSMMTRSITARERSKAGLDDQRVAICKDRGNSYHRQKYGHISISGSTSNRRFRNSPEELLEAIFKELREKVSFSALGMISHPYLPCAELRQILAPERIEHIVNVLPGFNQLSDQEKKTLTKEIWNGGGRFCRKPCLKVLAACIRVDRGRSFYDLLDRWRVTDECLPPVWDGKGPVECKSCRRSHIFLDGWDLDQKDEFVRWAHALNAPYFTTPTEKDKKHAHYVLAKEDIIPVDEVQRASNDDGQDPTHDGRVSGQYGAFSYVQKVRFHPDHCFLRNATRMVNENTEWFALKRLNSHDIDDFNRELASLLTFQEKNHQHIIQLLFSFEIRARGLSTFYFVFPWARGDLWSFFKVNDLSGQRPPELCQWMAEQSYGLAQALVEIHNERRQNIQRMESIKEDQYALYGIHGDIKSDNILWFPDGDRLVITDFGLGHLHTKISRSNGDPKKMGRTETYRAPEFDIPNGKISRLADVFSLGCVFLELVTWYLEGFTSAGEEFTNYRLSKVDDKHNFATDTFFLVPEPENVPIIKPEVKEWIQRLRGNPRRNNFILDFLDLIEKKMLIPDPSRRATSEATADKLYVFSQACRVDSSYYKDPV